MGQRVGAEPRDRMAEANLVVFGDELESVVTAVAAARLGVPVTLIRRSTGWLGGLSTRGGLSYMDITPEFIPPLMRELLKRCGFRRVALEPETASKVCQDMLREAGVRLISGQEPLCRLEIPDQPYQIETSTGLMAATHVIDATPDADVARALGVPYLKGLAGVLGEHQNFLGISPVFTVTGVDVEAFRAFEAKLRSRPDIQMLVDKALPHHPAALRAELSSRPTFMDAEPEKQDYLDVLNPIIGIGYHLWRCGGWEADEAKTSEVAASYASADMTIDGFNIALLPHGRMGFNGLVARLSGSDAEVFEQLLAYSHGAPVPECLLDEMRCFERFLQEVGGLSTARVIPPQELYVRQTVTLLARENMTAERAIQGGVSPNKAIGTYSYWLDLRGTQLWELYPGEHLPKPIFNVGLDVALPILSESKQAPVLENFAFVSRSAGYSPIGQGVGRIVQHNAMLGEALGVAAALSILSGAPLLEVCDLQISQIKAILDQRNGQPIPITGKAVWTEAQIRESRLLQMDNAAVARLREQVTLKLGVL